MKDERAIRRKLHEETWEVSDAATAYRVMTSGQEEASFLAAAEGKLRIDGMPAFVQWFTDGVKLAV